MFTKNNQNDNLSEHAFNYEGNMRPQELPRMMKNDI